MKPISIILASLLMTGFTQAQIAPGDNLREAYAEIAHPYFFAAPKFTPWAEGVNMLLIGTEPEAKDCEYVLMALSDTTLIGVYVKAENSFRVDQTGDGFLGENIPFFLLPTWTVKQHTRIDGDDKMVLDVLDALFETAMQSDAGDIADPEVILKYQKLQSDKTLANRHILLLLGHYQALVAQPGIQTETRTMNMALPMLLELAGECMVVYDNIPVIVCVYMGEALMAVGRMDEARKHFKMTLEYYPDAIPLQVYNYQLETDPKAKSAQRKKLKKTYPHHWMVKNL
jgi:hypothetical protein